MKNRINNKLLILTTIGAISMSGCVSKTVEVIDTKVNKVTVPHTNQVKVSKWKSLTNSKKEDCVDCYATITKESSVRAATVNTSSVIYDYSKAPADVDSINNIKLEEYKNPYIIDESYSEYDNRDESLYVKIGNSLPYDYSKAPADVDSINNIKLEEYKNPYIIDESYSEYDNRDESLYVKIGNSLPREENMKLSSKNSIQVGAFRKYVGAKVYAKRYSLLTSKYNVDIKENVKDNKPIYRVQIEGFSNENEARKFMTRYGINGAFLVKR